MDVARTLKQCGQAALDATHALLNLIIGAYPSLPYQ